MIRQEPLYFLTWSLAPSCGCLMLIHSGLKNEQSIGEIHHFLCGSLVSFVATAGSTTDRGIARECGSVYASGMTNTAGPAGVAASSYIHNNRVLFQNRRYGCKNLVSNVRKQGTVFMNLHPQYHSRDLERDRVSPLILAGC